jgi:hypothetical protein
MRRGQTADTAANYDEVVFLARVRRSAGVLEDIAIAESMCLGIRAFMAAAHAREGRGIVSGPVLREDGRGFRALREQTRGADCDGHAIDEIATRERSIHSEFAISL